MSILYGFNNGFPISSNVISNAQLTSNVLLLPDDGFVTITYSGSTTSRWFRFTPTALSDVVVAGIIEKSSTTTRFNDNAQDVAALSVSWVNNNLAVEPATQVWEDDEINFMKARIDIIQDAATTPIVRSYRIVGDGRQTTLARQPGDIRVEVFRIA